MKNKSHSIVLFLCAVIVACVILFLSLCKDAYYRGVYEGCVRQSAIGDMVTLFDLISCQEVAEHARNERWFEHELDVR